MTGYEQLKPGPGKSPEQVGASQRTRIHRAMAELAAQRGHDQVTVRELTRKARVSSRTFYLHFSNREDCLASTIDTVGHRFLRGAARPDAYEVDWQRRITSSLSSLLGDLGDQPLAARMLLVEALAAGRPGRTRATELTSDLERLFARLLAAAPIAPSPPKRLVAGIAAGVVRVATTTTLTGRAAELPGLAPALGDWIFDVYGERAVALCNSTRQGPGGDHRRERLSPPAEWSAFGGHGERERILAAASRLAASGGVTSLTVSRIRREAGVSRRGFDAHFRDATECFLATVDCLAYSAALKAYFWAVRIGERGQSHSRIMLALAAMAARNQPQARLVLEGILAPGREGLLLRERLISDAAERLVRPGSRSSSQKMLAAEASVAATWRIAQRDLLAGRARYLPAYAQLLSTLLPR